MSTVVLLALWTKELADRCRPRRTHVLVAALVREASAEVTAANPAFCFHTPFRKGTCHLTSGGREVGGIRFKPGGPPLTAGQRRAPGLCGHRGCGLRLSEPPCPLAGLAGGGTPGAAGEILNGRRGRSGPTGTELSSGTESLTGRTDTECDSRRHVGGCSRHRGCAGARTRAWGIGDFVMASYLLDLTPTGL